MVNVCLVGFGVVLGNHAVALLDKLLDGHAAGITDADCRHEYVGSFFGDVIEIAFFTRGFDQLGYFFLEVLNGIVDLRMYAKALVKGAR